MKLNLLKYINLCSILALIFLSSCESGQTCKSQYKLEFCNQEFLIEDYDSKYEEGNIIEIKTKILIDADINVFVNDLQIPKTYSGSDYWGYSFVMPSKDTFVKIVTKDGFKEILNSYSVDHVVNPTIINEPSFLKDLKKDTRYLYQFKNYEEYLSFRSYHFGEKIDGVYTNEEFDKSYLVILVARKSSYNARYWYYHYVYQNGNLSLSEDVNFGLLEDTLIFDFVFVQKAEYD